MDLALEFPERPFALERDDLAPNDRLSNMQTTLDIPQALLPEAHRKLGAQSDSETVVLALKEIVRRERLDELKSLLGKVELDLDLDASRRRFEPSSA